MNQIEIGKSGLKASQISLGCMRMDEVDVDKGAEVIREAYEGGVNFFDHADIYGTQGHFAKAFAKTGIKREEVYFQTKCGIKNGIYDFSKKHILESVEQSLQDLGTEYTDILLLHRPDALMEPAEIAEAFNELEKAGKVRHFGVSNHHPMQMELLKKYIKQPLIANQLQFSPVHAGMLNCGIQVNMDTPGAIHRDGMVLDYCRINDITVQAWSPYQYGDMDGPFLTNPDFDEVNGVIKRLARDKGLTDSAIVAAWIMRHPAKIQVVVGSMNPVRVEGICKARPDTLTREEWYEVYMAAGNKVP